MNPLLILVAGCSLGGLFLGGGAVNLFKNAQIAELKLEQTQAIQAAEQLYQQRYRAEIARGDALSNQLAKTEQSLTQRTLEVQRAIHHVTTGRACLSADAVRLLNHADSDRLAVPNATGASVTENAAIATDTDVAGWIGNTQGQYETCRARLGALIDYQQGANDGRSD